MNATRFRSMPPRPKVLQCISNFALGGAERVALDLVRAMETEFAFEIFAVRGVADGLVGQSLLDEARAMGVPVHIGARVPMRFGGVITSGFGLAKTLRRVVPDLIHLHTEIPEAAYAAAMTITPGFRRIPIARTIHNAVYWEFWPRLGRWCDRKMARSQVAAVSRGAMDAFAKLRRRSGAPPPPSAPILAYNGVQAPLLPSRRTPVPGEPLQVVYGGRFAFEKGTDLLPEVLRRVRLPAPGAKLTIFGSGRHAEMLRALAAAPPPNWRVEVHDPIPQFAMKLPEFDLAIVPSRYEGLGLVAIEALLAGLPVVATDAPGLQEVFAPGYPWLAAPGNAAAFAEALRDAIQRKGEWSSVLAPAREFIERRFSPSAMAQMYRELYARALSQSDSRTAGL